jgi:hypothetical protein
MAKKYIRFHYTSSHEGLAVAKILRRKKIIQFGHKHAQEHITGCWYIYEACL